MATTIAERSWAAEMLQGVAANARIAVPRITEPSEDDEASKLAKELGLIRQAEHHRKGAYSIPEAFASTILSGQELAVWQEYCPTSYTEGTEEFMNYQFDTIPLPVLRHWKSVREQFPFDSFQIWTTERPQIQLSDPLLIGIFQGVRYLIARWGKEAADLISFEEVRERVLQGLHDGFEISLLPQPIGERIRALQLAEEVPRRARYCRWYLQDRVGLPLPSFLLEIFARRHCGKPLSVFAFGPRHREKHYGICPSCGSAQEMPDVLLASY